MNSINENLKNVYAEIWEILKYLNIEDVMKMPPIDYDAVSKRLKHLQEVSSSLLMDTLNNTDL